MQEKERDEALGGMTEEMQKSAYSGTKDMMPEEEKRESTAKAAIAEGETGAKGTKATPKAGQARGEEGTGAQKKRQRRFFTIYGLALFSVALLLVVASYIAQDRAEDQLEAIYRQLNGGTEQTGAIGKIEAMQNTLEERAEKLRQMEAALQEESQNVARLEGENSRLEAALSEERELLQREREKNDALLAMAELKKVFDATRRHTGAAELLGAMEEKGQGALLPPEIKAQYDEIKGILSE